MSNLSNYKLLWNIIFPTDSFLIKAIVFELYMLYIYTVSTLTIFWIDTQHTDMFWETYFCLRIYNINKYESFTFERKHLVLNKLHFSQYHRTVNIKDSPMLRWMTWFLKLSPFQTSKSKVGKVKTESNKKLNSLRVVWKTGKQSSTNI